jgi:PAS domain-containing protein
MSEYSTFLKVGAASILLRMLEEPNVVLRDMTLENPIRAIREISHDMTCRRRVRLANGREASALEIQSEYLNRALKYAERRELSPLEQKALEMWEHCLTTIENDPLKLDRDIKQRIVRTDGELRVIRCVSIPVVKKEKVVRFVGTLMDITEQERLTGELRRSEFYLQEGERLAGMGSWSLKPDGSADYWSPQNFVFWGFDPSNGTPILAELLNAIHPDDHDFVMKTLTRMTQEGVGCDVRYRIIHPERGVRMLHSVGEAVIEDGSLVAVFVQDNVHLSEFTRRLVAITSRIPNRVCVRSEPNAAERAAGAMSLKAGERVLASGVLELNAELVLLKAAQTPVQARAPHPPSSLPEPSNN